LPERDKHRAGALHGKDQKGSRNIVEVCHRLFGKTVIFFAANEDIFGETTSISSPARLIEPVRNGLKFANRKIVCVIMDICACLLCLPVALMPSRQSN